MLATSKYAGKAYCENVHAVIARKLVKLPKNPAKYGHADSVSGYFHPFMSVGTEAKASLKIANAIAISGFFVTAQNANANVESKPHA